MHCRKRKVKSGEVWTCIAEGPKNPTTGKRRQIERRGKTRKEAKKRVEDALNAIFNDGIDESIAAHMTFEQVANKWLAIYEASGVKRGSVRIREKEVKLLNGYLAKAIISEINHYMY